VKEDKKKADKASKSGSAGGVYQGGDPSSGGGNANAGKVVPLHNRKHLSNVRVIQRTLVYVIGIPISLAKEDVRTICVRLPSSPRLVRLSSRFRLPFARHPCMRLPYLSFPLSRAL
jgi:hypothetical protein